MITYFQIQYWIDDHFARLYLQMWPSEKFIHFPPYLKSVKEEEEVLLKIICSRIMWVNKNVKAISIQQLYFCWWRMTNAHITLNIVPLHSDALLVSFNERLHPFRKETLWFFTKPCLQCLLVRAPNEHKFYVTSSHHALQLVQTHSWCPRLPLFVIMGFIFPDQGIHPMAMFFHERCWWVTRSAFICYTCSYPFSPFPV